MWTLQVIDLTGLHFREIDFSPSLGLESPASRVRAYWSSLLPTHRPPRPYTEVYQTILKTGSSRSVPHAPALIRKSAKTDELRDGAAIPQHSSRAALTPFPRRLNA